jgi:hypothetical protein
MKDKKKFTNSEIVYSSFKILDEALGENYSQLDLLNFANKLVKFYKKKNIDISLQTDFDRFYVNYYTMNLCTAFNKCINKILKNELSNDHIHYEEDQHFKRNEDLDTLINSSGSIFEGLVNQ